MHCFRIRWTLRIQIVADGQEEVKPDEALRLCLLAGLCITGAQVRVGGKDLRLDVPLVEEAVLALEEDVGDDVPLVVVEVRFRRRQPTVNQGFPHLERLLVLKEKLCLKFSQSESGVLNAKQKCLIFQA